MRQMWELKQQTDPGKLDIYIYGEVAGDSQNWYSGEIVESETSANHFRDELGKHSDVNQINIYINSNGGSVYEGTAIYNQLKRHPAHKTVYVDGFACSVASVIAMAGDEVIMPKNTLMMIHNAWSYAVGNAAELRKAADDLDVINQAGQAAYLEKAGDKLDAETLNKMMDAETWLTAEECVQYGLADKIAGEDADMSKAGEILQKATMDLEQRIKIHKSVAAQLRNLIQEPPAEPKAENPPQEQSTSIMATLSQMFKK